MTRRVKIGAALVAAAVIAVVVAWLVLGQNGSAQAGKPVTPTVGATHSSPNATGAVLTPNEATKLAANLVSADPASYRSAWYDTTAVPPTAPIGTKLVIDAGTFQSQANAGKVNAVITLPGKSPETWQLFLLRKDDLWTVYTMEEVK